MRILELRDLAVQFKSRAGTVHAVDGVQLWLEKGEILGIAGESGCGKTTAALSIPRLLPANASIARGEILFKGENLIRKSEKEMESIRWKEISVIFQGAMNAMNPLKTVGQQIAEPILLHEKKTSRAEAKERTEGLLDQVGVARNRFYSYPHEFSGGMKQRAMIAMSLACHPELVIADEPVTALDVMIQAQIMELIRALSQQYQLSMMMISHDLSVLAELCNKIAIMYAGKVMEYGEAKAVFRQPKHPYTVRLMNCFPNIYGERTFVHGIPGQPPSLLHPPQGCTFYERCTQRREECKRLEMKLEAVADNHYSTCPWI